MSTRHNWLLPHNIRGDAVLTLCPPDCPGRCPETNPSPGWRNGQPCRRPAGHDVKTMPHLDVFAGGSDSWATEGE